MITRRAAIAMLPAGLMAGSSFISIARAQPLQKPAINPVQDAASKILSKIEVYKGTPHHDATKALINALDRTASLRGAPNSAERRRNSKAELVDALAQINATYTPVTTVLDIRKKTDDYVEGDRKRALTPANKTEFGTKVAINNDKINGYFADLLKGGGDFDINKIRSNSAGVAVVNQLIYLTEELLDASIRLSDWGPDAFYAAVRGYVTFQFVRDRIRVSRSSPLLARAYMFKIIGESDSYFSSKVANLTAAPASSVPTSTPGGPPAQAPTANERFKVERDLIDNRFPRELYLGSELGNAENKCAPNQVVNHYGKLKGSFEKEFELDADGWSKSACTAVFNDRSLEAMNGLLGNQFKQFAPASGNEHTFRKAVADLKDALNRFVERVKNQKKREDELTKPGQPSDGPPTTPDQAAQQEFLVMQRMTSALREMLASV